MRNYIGIPWRIVHMPLNRVPLAGLLLAVAGCMAVRSVQPTAYIPQHSPAVVWVTHTNNTVIPVAQPRIIGDSLKGTRQGLEEPVAISLKEIQTVRARMSSPSRTIILISSLGVISTVTAFTILTAGNSGKATNNPNGCPVDNHGEPLPEC